MLNIVPRRLFSGLIKKPFPVLRVGTKILVINQSALGDVISSFGVMQALAERGCAVDVLTSDGFLGLFEGEIQKAVSWVEAQQNHYDIILDLTSSGHTRRQIAKLSGDWLLGRASDPVRRFKAVLTYDCVVPKFAAGQIVRDYDAVYGALGLRPVARPRLNRIHDGTLPESARAFIDSTSQRRVALHVFSKAPLRNLPVNLIADLIEELKAFGAEVFIVGTEAEYEFLQRKLNLEPFRFAGVSLKQLKMILSASDFFVGGDSGPLHLAAALGIPALGIYGPTSSEGVGPVASQVRFLNTNYPCQPCYQDTRCDFQHRCLATISRAAIRSSLRQLWSINLAWPEQSQ